MNGGFSQMARMLSNARRAQREVAAAKQRGEPAVLEEKVMNDAIDKFWSMMQVVGLPEADIKEVTRS